jgi:hypothetical protein
VECACGAPLCSDVPCIFNVFGCNFCYNWTFITGCENNIGQLKEKYSEKKGSLASHGH